MDSFLNIVKSNIIVQAVLSIVVGALLMFWPGITIVSVLYLVGIIFAIMGISSLVTYFRAALDARETGVLVTGVLFALIALIVFLFPQVIASFFSLVLGIILVICGVVNIVRSLEIKRFGQQTWIPAVILSAIITAGGLLVIANPFATIEIFVFVLGLIIASNGIVDLIIEGFLRKAERLEEKTS